MYTNISNFHFPWKRLSSRCQNLQLRKTFFPCGFLLFPPWSLSLPPPSLRPISPSLPLPFFLIYSSPFIPPFFPCRGFFILSLLGLVSLFSLFVRGISLWGGRSVDLLCDPIRFKFLFLLVHITYVRTYFQYSANSHVTKNENIYNARLDCYWIDFQLIEHSKISFLIPIAALPKIRNCDFKTLDL